MTVSWALTVLKVVAAALLQRLTLLSLLETAQEGRFPEEALSTGLETINSNLIHLSEAAEANESAIISELGDLRDLSESSAHLLISTTLAEKQEELVETLAEIAYLEEALYSTETECGRRDSCSACTSSADCVWCELEGRCALGGAQGPLGGVCTLYRYKECPLPECRDAHSCTACVVFGCVWCENGEICLEKEKETPLCEQFFVVQSVNQCKLADLKAGKPKNEYIPQKIPPNSHPNDQYRRLLQLKSSKKQLLTTIRTIQEALQLMKGKAERPEAKHAEMHDLSTLAAHIKAERKKENADSNISVTHEETTKPFLPPANDAIPPEIPTQYEH